MSKDLRERDRSVAHLKRAVSDTRLRRSLINELNFTYVRLLRLLPAFAARLPAEPVRTVLLDQLRIHRTIAERLDAAATTIGEEPQPCIGLQANILIEELRFAERNKADMESRVRSTLHALKVLRLYLVRTWSQLIDHLDENSFSEFREEAIQLQRLEADLVRSLVPLITDRDAPKS